MTSNRITLAEPEHFPAGDFSAWLRQFRASLTGDGGVDVACGDCVGCCSSSQFIHLMPHDRGALEQVPPQLLFKAPGLPEGHSLMGYEAHGICPMLEGGKCTIYQSRPQTCRNYDCRLFAAAGIVAGGDEKAAINARVKRWRFAYPTPRDREEHRAVTAAARFIREHADSFPGGRVPDNPSQLAIVAVKSYEVFLPADRVAETGRPQRSEAEVAAAVVDACRLFDSTLTV